jgi:hypothetical protein
MAENNIITGNNNGSNNNNSSLKRKFDKLKTKFYELFFSSSSKQVTEVPFGNNNNKMERTFSSNTLNNSMLISSYYYGYKTNLTEIYVDEQKEEEYNSKRMNKNSSYSSVNSPITSQKNKNILISSMTSSLSTSSSLSIEQHQQLHQSELLGTSDLKNTDNISNGNYATDYNENNINPFLNKQFTDLIHFNSDLTVLNSYFGAHLNLIDDQDNFFNMDFMLNYISYLILINIKNTSLEQGSNVLLKEMISGENVLKEIARQIYLDSESEPCGLKGCKLNVYLEKLNETILLTQFRFDSTCSLTTFELNLTLKQSTNLQSSSSLSGVNNLTNITRRILNPNGSSSTSNKFKQSKATKISENIIYIESNNFDLLMRKLY